MASSNLFKPQLWAGITSLHEDVLLRILLFAGREGSAAFITACGKGTDPRTRKTISIAERAMLHEPFTFFDWHSNNAGGCLINGEESVGYEKRKRRLLWERERAFCANGEWEAYPSPQARWKQFMQKISANRSLRKHVKRIAVASWMSASDMQWIAQNLTHLEALDLSDVPTDYPLYQSSDKQDDQTWLGCLRQLRDEEPEYLSDFNRCFPCFDQRDTTAIRDLNHRKLKQFHSHRDSPSYTQPLQQIRGEDIHETFEEFFWRLMETQIASNVVLSDENTTRVHSMEAKIAETHMWCRLKWLGLPDWRADNYAAAEIVNLIPRAQCSSLKTVSIRGEYTRDLAVNEIKSMHRYVCEFILTIHRIVPDSVTKLELRLSVPFVRYLMEQLSVLRPKITHVGIDLGAWIQVFPLENRQESKENAGEGEEQSSSSQPSFYQNRSGDVVSFPTRGSFVTSETSKDNQECQLDDSGNHTITANEVSRTCADTMPKLLKKLHLVSKKQTRNRSSDKVAGKVAILFPLTPEKECRSGDPIHPLTLAQLDSKADLKSGSDYKNFNLGDLKSVYPWLAQTFGWQPVVDWDWFMVPHKMMETRNRNLVNISSASDWRGASNPRRYGEDLAKALAAIRTQFSFMVDAAIPVHLLIGRRSLDVSSCYWGWPYDELSWDSWLKRAFSANLETIAPYIRILSIFYDLRNPLDEDRLRQLGGSHSNKLTAQCPRRDCPWKAGKDCPFAANHPGPHPRPQVSGASLTSDPVDWSCFPKQHSSNPTSYGTLATGCPNAPLAGENADDNPQVNGDPESDPYQAALRAAFAREAVGWQRFWTAYSALFNNLTTLRVRMPAFCDHVASWRLGLVLASRKGWSQLVYSDEQQHLQTADDLVETYDSTPRSVYEHLKQDKIWPGGRFVRRSWVRDPLQLEEAVEVQNIKSVSAETGDVVMEQRVYTKLNFQQRARTNLVDEVNHDIISGDRDEFAKALRIAREASEEEVTVDAKCGIAPPLKRPLPVKAEESRVPTRASTPAPKSTEISKEKGSEKRPENQVTDVKAAEAKPEALKQPADLKRHTVPARPEVSAQPTVPEKPPNEPETSEQCTVLEAPTIIEKLTVTEEAAITEEPAISEEPKATEEIIISRESTVPERPTVFEEPKVPKRPEVLKQPTVTKQFEVPAHSADPEQPENPESDQDSLINKEGDDNTHQSSDKQASQPNDTTVHQNITGEASTTASNISAVTDGDQNHQVQATEQSDSPISIVGVPLDQDFASQLPVAKSGELQKTPPIDGRQLVFPRIEGTNVPDVAPMITRKPRPLSLVEGAIRKSVNVNERYSEDTPTSAGLPTYRQHFSASAADVIQKGGEDVVFSGNSTPLSVEGDQCPDVAPDEPTISVLAPFEREPGTPEILSYPCEVAPSPPSNTNPGRKRKSLEADLDSSLSSDSDPPPVLKGKKKKRPTQGDEDYLPEDDNGQKRKRDSDIESSGSDSDSDHNIQLKKPWRGGPKTAKGERSKGKAVSDAAMSGPTSTLSTYASLTVVKLKAELKGRGIKLVGMTRKSQFIARLEQDDTENAVNGGEEDESGDK